MEVDFDLGFNPDSGVLAVEYRLPEKDRLPTLSKVTFVSGEMREKHVTERQLNTRYDSVCYQVAIRTLHELFESDEAGAYEAIVFNGWVESVDPATGQEQQACILSVQARREEFLAIKLSAVEPRACFKSLKGVSAARLAGLTPVQPILQLDRTDTRFVASRDVADALASGTNLAAMPWEEFEHLIRELFEQEFASSGGEVRVTQASRDGGVDAIAFDPDPIRGGKIVIQARRYTASEPPRECWRLQP
ncbi:MAG: restriction endonuclease [Dehalococcoidia bacterium]|jgi:restriction system protein|nr:restriction endonuclease [Dehalococcoidia bacterium]